jgi:hypothetical protein
MATSIDRSTASTARTQRLNETSSKKSTQYNFRIQSAPPLSLKQFLRSATGVVVGTKHWQSSGVYRRPIFNAYLSPAVKEKPKIIEPVWRPTSTHKEKRPTSLSPERKVEKRIEEPLWHPPGRFIHKRPTSLSPEKKVEKRIEEPLWHPPGRFIDKRPTSLSPEKKPQKSIKEPVWRPAGKTEHKPVPYFDPPNLRWSLQELLRSMPEMRSKTSRASSSMSNLRRSKVVEDT